MKFTVPEDSSLLEALLLAEPDCSKTTIRSWLKKGRVQVDGKVVKIGSSPVLEGQVLTLVSKQKTLEGALGVIYEDDHLIAVEKPCGLLSVQTAFEEEHTAHAILKRHFRPKRVFVVHRLDQDTSGVMLFALSPKAHQTLKSIFEKHEIERRYTALVEGHLDKEAGDWSSYLYEDNYYVVKTTKDKMKGELAISHYTVLGKSKTCSWLDVALETGKKNQIRVHCQSAGVPVVGDKKYGASTDPIKRLCLHAYYLSFFHPITGKRMRFVSPIPKSFYRLVKPVT